MKHRYLPIFLFSITVTMLFQSYSDGPAENGARATGAPGDGPNRCTNCHTGGNFGTVSALLTLVNALGDTVTAYVPEQDYTAIVEVGHTNGNPAGFGFQMLCLKSSNNGNQGGWSNPGSNAQLSTSAARNYVEHNAVSSTNTFTVDWTAPAVGTGALDFYIGANAVNGNDASNGDKAVLVDFEITEQADTTDTNEVPEGIVPLPRNEARLFPNPASDEISVQGLKGGQRTVTVVDVNGKHCVFELDSADRFNIGSLSEGYYFLIDADGKVLGRFLKM